MASVWWQLRGWDSCDYWKIANCIRLLLQEGIAAAAAVTRVKRHSLWDAGRHEVAEGASPSLSPQPLQHPPSTSCWQSSTGKPAGKTECGSRVPAPARKGEPGRVSGELGDTGLWKSTVNSCQLSWQWPHWAL